MALTSRLATPADLPALAPLVDAAIGRLLSPWLDATQVEASRAIMGVDTRLVDDGTYFVVFTGGTVLAGCGGWSRRATLYGGDHTAGRDDALLDPATQPARIRAMYTHPDHVRRGVGSLVLRLCEAAAAAEGFTRVELMATVAGRPLYAAAGYTVDEELDDTSTGVVVPLARMSRSIAPGDTPAERP
ncbi:GNAT family N-acetyltransferase [Pseudonocardia sp. N23]|uniref:GNAT family N-acetyltransferase n=1 Tax=Pseudonocardia sp. N23 TaxID=1987376 RepID=UPI000BFBB097|nr:GNAT family N-acetyltransferase [Pseudonocardia sp. N23]GAY11550.1 acetyltransferase, GNAT family [Pseudonocardia sp. N23]